MKKPSRFRRLPSLSAVMVAALSLSGCGLHSLHMQQSPLLKYFAPRSGHIAFLGVNGNVRIGDQSGHTTKITSDGQTGSSATVTYGAPTWSFNGKEVVFARFTVDPKTKAQTTTVFTSDLSGKKVRKIFSSKSISPFYFYWSPNDKEIGMLSQILTAKSQGGIQMGVIDLTPGNKTPSYHVVNADAPFYWVWGATGARLVAHTQTGNAQDAPDFVRIIPVGGKGSHVDQLKASLGAFDTPSIAAGGTEVVIPIGTSDASDLVARNLQTGKQRMLAKALGSVSYAVSPNGEWLAYIDQADSKDAASRELHVVNIANPRNFFTVKEKPVFTFHWSPNSREIAYVIPLQSKASIDPMFAQSRKLPYAQLQVIDVAKRNSWSVSQFPLTQAYLNDVPFDDQYQHSSTSWSPNSKYLVFSSYTAKGSPGIFVVGADGNIKPDLVASGEYPSWSWK